MSLRRLLPWWVRMPAKIALAGSARRSGLIRDGAMDRPEYALESFLKHFRRFEGRGEATPFTVLELGPGESVATGLVAAAYGASRTYLVDATDHVRRDLAVYRRLLAFLSDRGLNVGRFASAGSFEELLEISHTTFLTGGLADLAHVPSASIGLTCSNAVLEHVRLDDFRPTLAELYRVMSPGGLGSHEVDLRDHLGEAQNHLRFSDRFWESAIIGRSGFYTNRITFTAMIERCREAGFAVECPSVWRWSSPPTARAKLAPRFRDLPADELTVKAFHLLLRR
jgi:SAM-dependent methyltransferase